MIRYIFEGWQDRLVDINTIQPHPDNPNEGDLDSLIESVHINGCYRDVWVSRRTGNIVAGTHLYYAHLEAEATQIPVTWVDADPEAEIRILLVDNKITRLGMNNPVTEYKLLQRLVEDDISKILGTGYKEREIATLRSIVDDPMPPLRPEHGFLHFDYDLRVPRKVECPTCHHVFMPTGGSHD